MRHELLRLANRAKVPKEVKEAEEADAFVWK